MEMSKLLAVNQLITVEIGSDPGGRNYASRIESISKDTLAIATPIDHCQLVIPKNGTELKFFINHEQGKFSFASQVLRSIMDPIPLLIIKMPDKMIKSQRRQFLRVKTTIFPLECIVLNEDPDKNYPIDIATIDIGGGGLRFVGNDFLLVDTEISIKFDLPFKTGTVQAIAKIIRVNERDGTGKNRFESAAFFSKISDYDRDKIVKFTLQKQIESFRKGVS